MCCASLRFNIYILILEYIHGAHAQYILYIYMLVFCSRSKYMSQIFATHYFTIMAREGCIFALMSPRISEHNAH